MHATLAMLALAGLAGLCACSTDGHASTAQSPALPTPTSTPEVVFIPEMSPFPGVVEGDVSLTPGSRAAFDTEWSRVRASVAARVTADELVAVSRWARDQTRGFTPAPDWIDGVPMDPIGRADGAVVLAQTPEQSPIVLPSHAAIVHRRLIVAAQFDAGTRTIPRVYVTIRGWAEE